MAAGHPSSGASQVPWEGVAVGWRHCREAEASQAEEEEEEEGCWSSCAAARAPWEEAAVAGRLASVASQEPGGEAVAGCLLSSAASRGPEEEEVVVGYHLSCWAVAAQELGAGELAYRPSSEASRVPWEEAVVG